MKLQAVSNRFAKKDFWDLERLLEEFSLEQMIFIFQKKLPSIDTGFIIQSLTNFETADLKQEPVSLDSKSWEEIKSTLTKKVKDYLNGFL
jgi:hypothetical protein